MPFGERLLERAIKKDRPTLLTTAKLQCLVENDFENAMRVVKKEKEGCLISLRAVRGLRNVERDVGEELNESVENATTGKFREVELLLWHSLNIANALRDIAKSEMFAKLSDGLLPICPLALKTRALLVLTSPDDIGRIFQPRLPPRMSEVDKKTIEDYKQHQGELEGLFMSNPNLNPLPQDDRALLCREYVNRTLMLVLHFHRLSNERTDGS